MEQICEVIDSQVEKLNWFAEGFAKTARLEEHIMQLKVKKQQVLEPILRAIDQVTLKAEQKGNEIILEGDKNIKAVFDSRWTEEAVFNLLDNGVKYGKEGCPITIVLTVYEMFVRVDVKNWGEVIPKEEYNKIFTRFYRGSGAALVKDGVGLGLFLTRQIIMEQGGYMRVGAYGNNGNMFSIFLIK